MLNGPTEALVKAVAVEFGFGGNEGCGGWGWVYQRSRKPP